MIFDLVHPDFSGYMLYLLGDGLLYIALMILQQNGMPGWTGLYITYAPVI